MIKKIKIIGKNKLKIVLLFRKIKTKKIVTIKIYEFLVSTKDKNVKLTILHAYFDGLIVVAWSPV